MVEIRKTLDGEYYYCPYCREIFFDKDIAANHAEKAHGQPVKIIYFTATGLFVLSPEEIRRGEPYASFGFSQLG